MKKSIVMWVLGACLAASAAPAPQVKTAQLADQPATVSAAGAQGARCAGIAGSTQLALGGSSLAAVQRNPQPGPLCMVWCCDGGSCFFETCTGCAHSGGHGYPSESVCLANCTGASGSAIN
jgi:hypothetical protein